MPFSFTLPNAASTSAGVFSVDGVLVKTLWSGVKYSAGPHTQTWDGLNDEGNLAADGTYTVKVASSNVTYEWEGVIGNTSQAKTGSTVNRSAQFMTNMVVVGNFAYYAVAYTEGDAASYLKFDINNPQVRLKIHPHDGQSTYILASDGTYVYWGGAKDGTTNFVAATKVTDDSDVTFSAGEAIDAGNHRYSAIDITDTQISGMAVQKTGNYLLVAHATSNQIRVLDKKTGAFLRSWSVTNPKQIVLSDDNTLWVIHDGTVVEKFILNNLGAGVATGTTLPNILAPVALAVSPNGQTIAAIDGSLDNRVTTAGNHQVKAYSTSSVSAAWTLGQAGGYATDPTVRDDKFCFINTKSFENTDAGQSQPYIAFQPDGSFWVGDVGNLRSQHFSATRTYLNQVAYIGYFYSCVVDPNAPKRVFANYLEFEVDYSKPLSPSNGSWRLVKNWSYGRIAQFDNPFNRLHCLATLSNGRTYALAPNSVTQRQQVVELPPTGNIRYTGVEAPPNGVYQLFSDGSLWGIGDNRLGQPAVWTKQVLTGFDSNNNPLWGPVTTAATTPPVTQNDPLTIDGHLKRNQVTSTGVVVTFCSDRPNSPTARGNGYHLGGVQSGTGKWLWKTSPSTTKNYRGDYPADGAYDIGNGVEYAGTFAQALDRNIFWGYQGEFWKNAQTNKWNHYLDNGLLVGQFGVVRRSDIASEEAQYGLASNAVSGTFVKVGNDYYLYHCDEGFHAGIHRWKISGLNTIQEQTAATITIAGTTGLMRQQFAGEDLDNVKLTSSLVVATIKEVSQINSTRWTGFLSPTSTQTYTFYAAVNKKVRLWVDGKLLIDQWNNTAQEEFTSSSIPLEADKKYAIRMETSGGNAALAWSNSALSKEPVPATRFYTATITDNATGIPLNEGLPFNSSVVTELYGWSRSPTTDYSNSNDWGNKWLVQTNITSVDKTSPDINIQFRPPGNGLTATTSRNLSNGTTTLSKWSITGKVTYPANDFDKNKGNGYLQVLDEKGKIIARIYRQEVNWPVDYRLYLNDKIVAQGGIDSLYALGKKAQPFTLTATSSGIILQYAGLPAVTAAPLDPTSNWQHPKTLQVLFYSPIQDEHEINLSDLRFTASVMPALPTLIADDDQNTLSAWQSTTTCNIMVSEAAAAFVPYAGQITVGNVARDAGYWKFKLRDVANQQEGQVVESPAFTAVSPLPLKLIAFTATKAERQNSINWRTANEVNTHSFVVEKSVDNIQFVTVGTVPAGNASGIYSLADKDVLPGVIYYRLKMVDKDASFTYSPVVTINSEALELMLYPNPAQHMLQVRHPLNTSSYLEVMTITGKRVLHQELAAGSTDTTLDVQSLSPGLYYLQYKCGAYTTQKLFTKQ
jgi:hypothetical protein